MLPEDLDRRMRAFQESRVLLTAIELDLFSAVGGGGSAAEAARTMGTDPRATEMLMNALVALGLLEKTRETYWNTPETARFFTRGAPGDLRLATMHRVHLWDTWSTLTECVRKGTAVRRRPDDEEWTNAFIAAMHARATGRVATVIQAVGGVARIRRMLDLGGGSGAYSIAFAQANPALRAEIIDVAAVVPIAQRYIEEAGLSGRVAAREGDLRTSELGTEFDLVLISSVCHMLGPAENRWLVQRAFGALAKGGRVVIQDFVLDPGRTGPRHVALFALNMLVGTREGNAYTEDEYSSWMRDAGFDTVRRVDMPGTTNLMIGTRP
jgi:predicted O-methyltransferase YrrM